MLRELNPLGTLSRTRRRFVRRTYHSMGPNDVWHVDGYDKLKPFGIGISGCIDGFSRKIMWLKCGPTNKNPEVIKNNFIDCIRNVGVIPMRLRTDCGTENGLMESVQCTLRHDHSNYYAGAKSQMFGSSMSNQRIESWWSIFRKQRTQFWMDLFADLRDLGHFNGTHEHQCLLRFCFMTVLQADLVECVHLWKRHRIRPSRLASCLGGIPNELYYYMYYLTGLDHETVAWMKYQPTFFGGIRQKIHVMIQTSMTIISRQCNNMDFNIQKPG
ncbi:hypothetical protein NQZ68_027893 [Dissostichus eleginoides]|nr:hypothetical protein NQZ68_027893 [Dissostichus eleginoides]